ncbi:hypothetical protein AK830_g1485 [Neonectria ditissima]|uniref:Uncharacterized protein n=1 Tax=Neonectria ditissima TaxID=78410 RepID=A0A0P7B5Y6_9HYPO|nr:hypothetical protein AK830_g1485 [Neonectria ditissima]
MPVYTTDEVWEETKTNSLMYTGSRLAGKLTDRTTASSAHVRRHPEQKNEVGAVVGGTIAAGVMLGLTFFICLRVYKEYLLYQQARAMQANNPSTNQPVTDTQEHNKSFRNTLFGVGASFGRRGPFSRSFAARTNSASGSISSDASFGNVATTAQGCPMTPFPGPAVPPKAAELVGIRQKQSIYDVQGSPVPTSHVPFTPAPTTPQFPPLCSPRSHRGSDSSMSTLCMSLLQDTMHSPSPSKYPATPLPERPLPPLPALESVDENMVERGQSRRYFVPPLRAGERLLSPISPAETLGMESVYLERWKGTRFSMGDNKF